MNDLTYAYQSYSCPNYKEARTVTLNAHSVGVTVAIFKEDEEGAKRAFNAAVVLKKQGNG